MLNNPGRALEFLNGTRVGDAGLGGMSKAEVLVNAYALLAKADAYLGVSADQEMDNPAGPVVFGGAEEDCSGVNCLAVLRKIVDQASELSSRLDDVRRQCGEPPYNNYTLSGAYWAAINRAQWANIAMKKSISKYRSCCEYVG